MKDRLVLLTKHYPFGKSETYLNNEIPYLLAAFEKIYIVPVEEFDYCEVNELCANHPRINVLTVNKRVGTISIYRKSMIQLYSLIDILREVITGRESMQHIRNLRMCFIYSKLTYCQATSVYEILKNEGGLNKFCFYSYWLHKSVLLLRGLKKISRANFRIVSRAHSSDLYHKDWSEIMRIDGSFMPFEKTKLYTCDEIHCISNHGLTHLNKLFPSLSDKFKLARLGVQAPMALSPVNDWGMFRIVTCSAIQPHKRIYRIPEILSLLEDLTIEWVHFGGGNKEDEDLLMDEIKRYGLEEKVDLRRHVPHHQIIEFYSTEQVNLILNLSYAEGIPVSLMEAISAGIPAIATKAVGNPEIIDSSCGFIIPIEFTANEVAERVRQMYADKQMQLTLRNGARAMFEKRYSAEVNYTQFARHLKC